MVVRGGDTHGVRKHAPDVAAGIRDWNFCVSCAHDRFKIQFEEMADGQGVHLDLGLAWCHLHSCVPEAPLLRYMTILLGEGHTVVVRTGN